jgi:hypothetical protein
MLCILLYLNVFYIYMCNMWCQKNLWERPWQRMGVQLVISNRPGPDQLDPVVQAADILILVNFLKSYIIHEIWLKIILEPYRSHPQE